MLNHFATPLLLGDTPSLLGGGLPQAGVGAHVHSPAADAVFCSINYSWPLSLLRETVLYENDCRASWVYENPWEAQLLATREKGDKEVSFTFGMAPGSSSWCCMKSEGNLEQRNTTDPPEKFWPPAPVTQLFPPRAVISQSVAGSEAALQACSGVA